MNAFNAKLRETQASLGWEDARLLLSDAHRDLIAFIADHSDTTLYAAPMKGGNGKWTTGRFAEAAGASHYRSAAKFVRAMLKPDRTNGPV